ncbi:MAG: flagellar protein FlaG [Nitrospirota bacterium]
MNITAINISGTKAVNSAEDVSAGTARQTKEKPNRSLLIAPEAKSSQESGEPEKKAEVIEPVKADMLKAFFAVDRDDNVVIRFVDSEGKIVKQFPPEEYLEMMKQLEETVESLFSVKV